MFKKAIKEGSGLIEGFIQYKFVSSTTDEISEQVYKGMQEHRNSIVLAEKAMEMDQEYKRLL